MQSRFYSYICFGNPLKTVCCIGATRVVHERTSKSKNDATIEELSRLGIADGHNL